jgi:hypothetical protein
VASFKAERIAQFGWNVQEHVDVQPCPDGVFQPPKIGEGNVPLAEPFRRRFEICGNRFLRSTRQLAPFQVDGDEAV